jgi:hypothetical protein
VHGLQGREVRAHVMLTALPFSRKSRYITKLNVLSWTEANAELEVSIRIRGNNE